MSFDEPTSGERAAAKLLSSITRNGTARLSVDYWWTNREPAGRFRRWPQAVASLEDVTEALETLGVPFEVAVMARTLDDGARQAWFQPRVLTKDLPSLIVWVPLIRTMSEA